MPSLRNAGPLDAYVNINTLIYQLQNGKVILERIDDSIKNKIKNPIVINCCKSKSSDADEIKKCDILKKSETIIENPSENSTIINGLNSKSRSANETKQGVIVERFDSMAENSIKNATLINSCKSKNSNAKKSDILKNSEAMIENSSDNENSTSTIYLSSKSSDELSDELFFLEQKKKTALRISNPYCRKCNKTVISVRRKDKNCPQCGMLLFYKCMKCNKQYSRYGSILYHLHTSCSPGTKFHCNKCDYSTMNKYIFNKHSKTHIFTKTHLCTKCGDKFTNGRKHKQVCSGNRDKINNDEKGSDKFTDESKITKNQNIETSIKDVEPNKNLQLVNQDNKIDKKYNDDKEANGKLINELSTKKNQNIETQKKVTLIDHLYSVKKKNINDPLNIKRFCQKCDEMKIYATQSRLEKCKTCSETLIFQCGKCNKSYHTYKGLKYHFEAQCRPEATYNCVKCRYKTTVHHLLKKHILKMHKKYIVHRNVKDIVQHKERPQCLKCNNYFKNAESFKKHKQYCGKEPDYFCTNCPYKTVHRQNLRCHLYSHKGLNEKMMENILEMNTNNIKVAKNKKSSNSLILQTTENLEMIRLKCLYCNKSVNCNSTKKNCPKCETLLLLQCKICSETCSTFHDLSSHIKQIHDGKLLTNPSKCLKCNKEDFQNRESFVRHIKYCQEPKHLQCKYCSYKTCFKSNLTSHIKRMHSKLKQTTL